MGAYEIIQDESQLTIKYENANADAKEEKKAKILGWSIWAIMTVAFVSLFVCFKAYGHAILFFIVLGLGGFYLCFNLNKREEVKYFSVVFDRQGVHEIWNYPNNVITKDIDWKDLKTKFHFSSVVMIATKPSIPYDCIAFSTEELDEKLTRKLVRKTWQSSMQYETKFRNIPNSIFIMTPSTHGEALYNMIQSFEDSLKLK